MELGALHAAAADLLLGHRCVGCEEPGPALCPTCLAGLVAEPSRTRPDPCPAGLPPVWASTAYAGVVRQALVAHKEDGQFSLSGPLGYLLAGSVTGLLASFRSLPGRVNLVPVPSRPAVVRARGHDPLFRVSASAARTLRRDGVDARVTKALRQTRSVADQAGLSSAARAANLAGAFQARRRRSRCGAERSSAAWVVVDDIVTTGATALAAADALLAVGVAVDGVAVVAATARRTPSGAGT